MMFIRCWSLIAKHHTRTAYKPTILCAKVLDFQTFFVANFTRDVHLSLAISVITPADQHVDLRASGSLFTTVEDTENETHSSDLESRIHDEGLTLWTEPFEEKSLLFLFYIYTTEKKHHYGTTHI